MNFKPLIIILALIIGTSIVIYSNINIADSTYQIDAVITPIEAETAPTFLNKDYSFIQFSDTHTLKIDSILQMPDYPTGCELISLAMALNYYTGNDTLDVLYNNHITITDNNFVTGYMGDPKSHQGGGCFPPALINFANSYLESINSSFRAYDMTGITKKQIFQYIDNGLPIIMWTTMYMAEPNIKDYVISSDGINYTWYTDEHCVLIKGYDTASNKLIINDPLIGEVLRDIDEFIEISQKISGFAVVIS